MKRRRGGRRRRDTSENCANLSSKASTNLPLPEIHPPARHCRTYSFSLPSRTGSARGMNRCAILY